MRDFTYAGDNKWERGKIYDWNGSDWLRNDLDWTPIPWVRFYRRRTSGRTDVVERQVK
jgi:hypothetical protein